MLHAEVSYRAPTSLVRGSFCSAAASRCLSRFSVSPNVDGGFIKGGGESNYLSHQPKIKPLKIHSVEKSGGEGSPDIQRTLRNLAKLWSPDGQAKSPVEKLINQDRVNGGAVSPKQSLGTKWREYQGSNNWEGLLDPLEENLRREIVRYGEFVQAAYSAFEFDTKQETYGCSKYSEAALMDKVGLRGCGYRVTKNILATSGIRVPKWLTRADRKWMATRTSFAGFVAVCDDQREISRIGRRDIVVAYRGTVTPLEWAENLKDVLTPLKGNVRRTVRRQSEPKVESGFWSLFTTRGPRGASACDQVLAEVRHLVDLYKGENISITVTGHSLGAALSLLTAYQISEELKRSNPGGRIPVTVFSFGGPRVGNRAFGRRMEEMGAKVLRIVNTHDVITKVPGVLLNETWMQRCRNLVGILESMPWAYCHLGTELRVNNKNSPFLKPDADMSCCHDLEAYLHLVDGFLSSKIPFRSTAKRNLVRLLMNQKSNVLLSPEKRIGPLDKEISWQ